MDNKQSMAPDWRSLRCSLTVLSQSDGSAKFAQGDTSVIGNVCGPTEQKNMKESIDKLSINVTLKSKSGSPSLNHKFIERIIQQLCESTVLMKSYACKTCLSVVIQEMSDDGSFLACCANATCAALLDACINIRFLFAAINIAIYPENIIIIDPTKAQESASLGCITFIYNKGLKLIAVYSKGRYSNAEYELCLEKSKACVSTIFDAYLTSIYN